METLVLIPQYFSSTYEARKLLLPFIDYQSVLQSANAMEFIHAFKKKMSFMHLNS